MIHSQTAPLSELAPPLLYTYVLPDEVYALINFNEQTLVPNLLIS